MSTDALDRAYAEMTDIAIADRGAMFHRMMDDALADMVDIDRQNWETAHGAH